MTSEGKRRTLRRRCDHGDRRRSSSRGLWRLLALLVSAAGVLDRSAAQPPQPVSGTLCADSDSDLERDKVLVPSYAAAKTADEFQSGWNETMADLER